MPKRQYASMITHIACRWRLRHQHADCNMEAIARISVIWCDVRRNRRELRAGTGYQLLVSMKTCCASNDKCTARHEQHDNHHQWQVVRHDVPRSPHFNERSDGWCLMPIRLRAIVRSPVNNTPVTAGQLSRYHHCRWQCLISYCAIFTYSHTKA